MYVCAFAVCAFAVCASCLCGASKARSYGSAISVRTAVPPLLLYWPMILTFLISGPGFGPCRDPCPYPRGSVVMVMVKMVLTVMEVLVVSVVMVAAQKGRTNEMDEKYGRKDTRKKRNEGRTDGRTDGERRKEGTEGRKEGGKEGRKNGRKEEILTVHAREKEESKIG